MMTNTNERYHHIKNLEQGGQCNIELCKDNLDGSLVVLKRCLYMSEAAHKRLFREAAVMSSIAHPNLVKYKDFYEDPPTLVMEYVDGGTLAQKLAQEKKLDWHVAFNILLQVIEGLSALHEKGIIHRDIKPANILFTQSGIIKLCDFGVVKCVEFWENLTDTNAEWKPGTMVYAPKELFTRDLPSDIRWDIYSLGVVLYEMLTGKKPFEVQDGPSHAHMLTLVIGNGTYRHPLEYVPDLPDQVSKIIQKAMAVEMEKRYGTLAELKDVMVTALNDDKTDSIGSNDKDTLVVEKTPSTTKDPLAFLEKELGSKTSWASEAYCEVPSRGRLEAYCEIKSSLPMMPEWRKETALHILLKFAIKHGRWKEACELSSHLHRSPDFFHRHLLTVTNRIDNHGGMLPDFCQNAKNQLRSSVWPETTFVCKQCKKTYTEEDVAQNRVFFFPAIYCYDCMLKAGDVRLADYTCSKLPVMEDILGRYFIAVSPQRQPYLVHRIPWERDALPRKTSQQIIERYKRGIRLASALYGIPWILSINNQEPIEDRKYTYFFLDYYPCRRLSAYVREGESGFSLTNIYILTEILRGLELLYAIGAVHRHLSPHYINIGFPGDIWIGGFNLAKFINSGNEKDWVEHSMEISKIKMGHPAYMASEQLKGMRYVDHRSDIWSFGAVAYYVLTGKSLFDVADADILKLRRQPLRYTPICELAKDTPKPFAAIIDKCLKEKPEERYQNASTLLGDIAQIASEFYNTMVDKGVKA